MTLRSSLVVNKSLLLCVIVALAFLSILQLQGSAQHLRKATAKPAHRTPRSHAVQTDLKEEKQSLKEEIKSVVVEELTKFETKVNENINAKFQAMDEKFEAKFDAMDEKFEAKFDAMNQTMIEMNMKLDEVVDLVKRNNPSAMLESIRPHLAIGFDGIEEAILGESSCTWTYLKRGPKYFAVSAKHCMFFYATEESAPAFARMPLAVLQAGVERVGYATVKEEKDNESYIESDFAIVELKGRPIISDESLSEIPEYPTIDMARHNDDCSKESLVFGRGASAQVVGEGIITFKADYGEYFLTVLKFAEPGNSGTLMYSPITCGALTKGEPFGVFSGRWDFLKKKKTLKKRNDRPGFHFRGAIVPLPKFDDIEWRNAHDPSVAPPNINIYTSCESQNAKYVGTPSDSKKAGVYKIPPEEKIAFALKLGDYKPSQFGLFLDEERGKKTVANHCQVVHGTVWHFDFVEDEIEDTPQDLSQDSTKDLDARFHSKTVADDDVSPFDENAKVA